MSSSPRHPARTSHLLAWSLYDWGSSAFSSIIQTFVFAAYFKQAVTRGSGMGDAQWGQAIGCAGLVVAVGGPLLGAVADQTGRRKPWIAGFTWLCVLATALLWFVQPDRAFVPLALVLVAVATVAEEFAALFYSAMLPDLAAPGRIGRWSGWAWGLGYAGGLVSLLLALFGFVSPHAWFSLDRTGGADVRATFLLTAGWFLVFSLPLLLVTPDVPRSPLSLAAAARGGVTQLLTSLRHARRYGSLLRFLIARMIYIDGLATVFAFGGIYAAHTFHMSSDQVIVFGIVLNLTAGLGAAAFAWIDDWLGGKRTILLALTALLVTTIALLVITPQWLFWVLSGLLGVFVGPVQAASRSYLARLAPPELRNEMFGLYALSGKATAFLGPTLVGWISVASGSQRLGMSMIAVLFVAGLVLMLTVQGDRAARQAVPTEKRASAGA